MNLAVLERKGINVIEKPISTEAIIVRDSLIEHGLETPLIDNGLSNVEKYQRVKAAMTEVVSTLGLDLNDDSLAETPHRICMFKRFFLALIIVLFQRSRSSRTKWVQMR